MKKFLIYISILLSIPLSASTDSPKEDVENPKVVFNEIWGYLMRDEENRLHGNEPFTDIGYFSLWISSRGKLSETPKVPKITLNGNKPRIHLVITELTSTGFTHFCIDKKSPVRNDIINDIVKSSENFAGIQIDFEQVASSDKSNFIEFLSEIRRLLPKDKIFSVAVPAKRIDVNDAYDYQEISKIADRVIIMAYDQHWSGSKPGPVAGYKWCAEVLKYTSTKIENKKIVMGLPLYGRSWGKKNANKALKYNDAMNILSKRKAKVQYSFDSSPFFQYKSRGIVTVYFDNTESLLNKINHYNRNNVNAISFWRIGQGPKDLWNNLDFKDNAYEENYNIHENSVPAENTNLPSIQSSKYSEKIK